MAVADVVVRFHGGFLEGQCSRRDDPETGSVLDYWDAAKFHEVTGGRVGAYMSGVSPEGFASLMQPSTTAPTVVLHHRYRVSKSEIEDGVLTIDATYEFARD